MRKHLTWASLAFLATLILHTLDHVRQGRAVEPLVGALGVVADVAAITVVALAIRRSRWAAPAAFVVGFANVLGLIAVHLVPDWGPLADGYPGLGVDALSWVAVAIPMAAALWLGLAGLAQLRAQRHAASPA